MKLFPNFTSIPFDYLLISWVTNYVSNLGLLTCLSWIVSIENSTLSNVYSLNLAYVQNFSTKYPLEAFLMCSFVCSGFPIFMPWHLHSWHFKLRRHLDTETYGRLLDGNFVISAREITNYCWNFAPELRSN